MQLLKSLIQIGSNLKWFLHNTSLQAWGRGLVLVSDGQDTTVSHFLIAQLVFGTSIEG